MIYIRTVDLKDLQLTTNWITFSYLWALFQIHIQSQGGITPMAPHFRNNSKTYTPSCLSGIPLKGLCRPTECSKTQLIPKWKRVRGAKRMFVFKNRVQNCLFDLFSFSILQLACSTSQTLSPQWLTILWSMEQWLTLEANTSGHFGSNATPATLIWILLGKWKPWVRWAHWKTTCSHRDYFLGNTM